MTLKLPLDDDAIRRYSRQILVREIGGAGQRKLLAARVEARGVAAEYLRRAGVQVTELPDEPCSPPTPIDRWVSGAMAAADEIKRIVGR